VFRISFGLLALWTGIGIALNLERYWGPHGLVPWQSVADLPYAHWSLCALFPDSLAWLGTLTALFTLAALGVTLGTYSRACCFLLFVLHVSFQHRNPYILNSGDRLFAIVAALATFLPLDRHAALLPWLSARVRGVARPVLPAPSGWMQRLMMCQLAYVYWFSCVAKLRNAEWTQGFAIKHVLGSPIYAEWPLQIPNLLSLPLSWSTLAFECAFPLLIWFDRWRPRLLIAGLLFHLGIEITMTIPMFSAIMLVCYPLFLVDSDLDTIKRLGQRLRAYSSALNTSRNRNRSRSPT
jgi:hypothetical protein